jgi:hypothetical protein
MGADGMEQNPPGLRDWGFAAARFSVRPLSHCQTHDSTENMFLGLDLKTWLGLTVLGAAISMVGALAGIVLKDYFFTRSLERWRQRQTLDQVYQRFRDPLVLAARELASRTLEILDDYPPVYLRESVLATDPKKQIENSIEDAYYQKYKLLSTAYRLCAFLAWLELYRQEITFLHSGDNKQARAFAIAVSRIRGDLADGQINVAEDWHEWRDTLIFREELRAIGESFIEARWGARSVMGYGRYCEQLECDSPNAVRRWTPVVLNFYLDLEAGGKDFRQVRIERIYVHRVDLNLLFDELSFEPYQLESYAKLQRCVRRVE